MANRKQILKIFFSVVGLGLLYLAPGAAYAATCTSAASASWNLAGAWSCGHVPLVGNDVVIAAGHAVTVTANATCNSVSMAGASASTLTISPGYSLAVASDITMNGALLPTAASHTINVGAGSLNTLGNLVMLAGAGAGNGGVNISVGTGSLSVTNTTTLTSGVTRVARITGGAGPITATGTLTLDGRLSTGAGGAAVVTLGAGALHVGGDLILTAGTVANSATVTRGTGTITVGGGVKLTGGAGTGSATIAGDTGAITIGADLELLGGASASSATIAVGASGPISVTGNLKMTGGAGIPGAVLSIGTNSVMSVGSSVTINNPTANSRISFTGSGGTLNVAGSFANGASFVPGSGVVNYNGAANQTVGTYTYNNLTLSGSQTKTFPNTAMTIGGNLTLSGTAIAKPNENLTVNGDLVIAANTTFLADVFTHNIKGHFSGGGTLDPAQGTFIFSGTSAQTLAGPATFYNLTLNNATGVTASDVITILGNITNTAGFTAGTSTVVFSGGDVSTVTGVTTFNNLTMNKSNKELTLNNNASVSGILTLTNLNIITGANTLAITATGSVTRDPVTGGHIIGNLSRHFPVDASVAGVTRDFPIGTLSGYAPVSMTFFSVTTGGNMTAKTTLLDHPMIDGAVIDPDLDVNLYWTLSKGANIVFENADVTFNFTADDLDNNAIPQNFIAQSYTPDVWGNTMLLELLDTSTTIGGVTAFGDFAIGQSTLVNFSHEKEFVFTRELY